MASVVLFDNPSTRLDLLPLAFTRPVAEFRVGITTIRDKWERVLQADFSYLTEDYLSGKYPCSSELDDTTLFIAGNILPCDKLVDEISALATDQALVRGDSVIAYRGPSFDRASTRQTLKCRIVESSADPIVISQVYDIFSVNGRAILDDFQAMVSPQSQSLPLSDSNRIIGPTHDADGRPLVFLANGAKAEGVIFNTNAGPIYLGPGAEVMEGSCLRGPVAVGTHATVNMSSKIYPATTIGPWCKVGGELNNVVIFGFSNKAHDGFLGNAVIGEWCNLGAGCTASNLKNDYSTVRLWNYRTESFQRTSLQFCGLIMGDHSKAGINTMFNTATIAGVGVNVYGAGFPRTFIASFSQGGSTGFNDVPLNKFFDIATRVMARRGCELTDEDRRIFETIYKYAHNIKN